MNAEHPAAQVLRSLDVEPDAALVAEPGPLAMRPSTISPEQLAEMAERQSARNAALDRVQAERRRTLHRRYPSGLGGLG